MYDFCLFYFILSVTDRSMVWSKDIASTFSPVDYVLFFLVFILSLAVGLYHAFSGGRQQTTDEYLMGNRQMGLLPITLSLCVSVVSATTLLGAPAEVFQYGIQFSFLSLSLYTGGIVVSLAFLPMIYPLMLTSVHEVSVVNNTGCT